MGKAESKLSPPGTVSFPTPEEIKLAKWKEEAQKKQQLYLLSQPFHFRDVLQSICVLLKHQCKHCSKHDDGMYPNNAEMNALKQLVGTLLFGKPKDPALPENSFTVTGFNKDQMKEINIVFTELVKGISDNCIEIAIIWISLFQGGKNKEPVDTPVFRVPGLNKQDTQYNFVDLLGRRYNDWKDFVSNNKLPPSQCYCPLDGIYTSDEKGEVKIFLDSTPAAKVPAKILRVTDFLGAGIGMGAGVGLLFCPPAFIACAVASGVVSAYGVVRSSVTLADRGNHNQSIKDKEAFKQWVSLVGSILGLGTSGALVVCKVLAAEGKLVSEVVPAVMDGLKCVNNIVSGIGAVDHVLELQRRGMPLDPLQSFQLAAHLMLLMACAGSESMVRIVIEYARVRVMPILVDKIKAVFKYIGGFVDLKGLLKVLDHICQKFSYGREVMRAIRIIIDCYNCKSLEDAKKIVPVFTDLLNHLYFAKIENSPPEAVPTEKEIMSEIVTNDTFIPGLLQPLETQDKNFHFPSDHCHWDNDGKLSAEEYTLIGQNFFGIPKGTQSHVWMDRDSVGTAHVHFEQYGLVTIKSYVDQQLITLKNVKKTSQCVSE
ncbi:uncharacterized protein LOC117644328 [Thrips palmi]|uniref:Uncharacterized protein LOC117644328 n=1 Tax=Thrips palmi TaxID=161013 RepID=A0A6P8YQI8_THRPL|nr:uncharacterized protein LOC117644328 [Thrips palmi]